ncbi:MAG: hypothetical protein M3Z57_05790, partial [Candidatus Dormibacteraeota bacterium]|nr:hypothetical protein [Candidatus Dormibacteraeota bacterium]
MTHTPGPEQPTRATPDPVVEPVGVAGKPAGAVRRAVRTVAVDVSPLRDFRDFRLLFIGQAVSFAGTMITYVAVPFQAYAL